MTEWQDISTAPKYTVVLTDKGTGICEALWSGAKYRWYLCHSDGLIPSCADYGREGAEMEPTKWMPFPPPEPKP
jgi:hypothetical protein